jgi:hypothetical protein
MKLLIIAWLAASLALAAGPVKAQELTVIHDTVYHFQIGVPSADWVYKDEVNSTPVKFYAYRQRSGAADTPRESFNLSIIPKRYNSSLYKEFRKFISYSNSSAKLDIKEVDSLDIHGQKWLWIVDTHQNMLTQETMPMGEYVLISFKDETTYILTFMTRADLFVKYRPLFVKIAGTMVLDVPADKGERAL